MHIFFWDHAVSGVCLKQERNVEDFVEVWENQRHCAKPSTQRCLDLGPVSDKLLNFAGEEKEKDEEKLYHFQILKYIQFTI